MKLEDKRAQLAKIYKDRNEILLIYVLCTGNTLNELETLIQIGKKCYRCENLVSAVDSCFKIGVLFNNRFPVASNPIWQFLRLTAYEFTLKSMYASVNKLNLKIGRVVKAPVQKKKQRKLVSLPKSGPASITRP